MRVKLSKAVTAPAAPAKKAKRRIKSAKITHISLCGKGKNNMAVMLKSDGAFGLSMLTKAVGDELHAVVWVPEENGAVDLEGDAAPAEVVKQFAHDFVANMLKEGGGIDIDHNLEVLSVDQVRLAETFIVQKGDPRFQDWKDNDGNVVDVTGAWAVILKILDPILKSLAARGELGGVSMFGRAQVEMLKADLPLPQSTPSSDEDMNLTDEQMTKLAEAIAKALKPAAPAPTPTPAPAAQAIEFEGDPLNPEDLAKHQDKLLLAKVNWADPKSVAQYQAHVAKRQAEMKKAEAGKDPNADQIAALEKQLAELKKASGAPVTAAAQPQNQPAPETGLVKAEADLMKHGKGVAARFNKRFSQQSA